ncbi:uncharacterized protein KY384_007937 [Bacidia gigantensis]|uniref:uncharacterized protein n=1 Tax=Bacidia gigantensis TaxID=2732470 RepID=UPI001D0432FC|nr:uncharacterized protein KY384_007937 [Bacidia gigantensis]KAG8527783.1 hypothetical protein KY384_007937 [Bacidia gigantensis]
MGYPDTFEGFMIEDQKNWTDFKRKEFKPKPFESHDVDIKIDACGVCGSDVHTINGGWGECPLPICVGHEVIGKAIKVGDDVTTCKVGDRVGVGAQIQACLECRICKMGQENYCPNKVDTYGAKYKDGTISQGGYASHIRAHEYFTFKIPDNISTADAGPMMCAGLTVWSPLVRAKVGPGKKVGVVGIGGLGHFALLWASALGAEVYALSSNPSKKDDALKLGAKEFICTTADKEHWHEPWAFTFDFLLNTADMTHKFNIEQYTSTVGINGEFHHVGLPNEPLPPIMAQMFTVNGSKMGASHIGNRPELLEMLKMASEKGIKPMVQTLQLGEKGEGCAEAVRRVEGNDVRYRFSLVGFDKVFGS